MKKFLTTAALALALASPAAAVEPGPHGPVIFGKMKRDCVLWVIVPLPCHEGYDYVEPHDGDDKPRFPRTASSEGDGPIFPDPIGTADDLIDEHYDRKDRDKKDKKPNAGGGNGSEPGDDGTDVDPGNSGNTPAAGND